MSVFSNMESVAPFVKDMKAHNVTSHPDHEIHMPPWMFFLFARKFGWSALLVSLQRGTGSDSPSLLKDMV